MRQLCNGGRANGVCRGAGQEGWWVCTRGMRMGDAVHAGAVVRQARGCQSTSIAHSGIGYCQVGVKF